MKTSEEYLNSTLVFGPIFNDLILKKIDSIYKRPSVWLAKGTHNIFLVDKTVKTHKVTHLKRTRYSICRI